MDKETYLKRFTRAVRWRLPKAEADEVLADYGEMLSRCCVDGREIPLEELGKPAKAAKLLTERTPYFRWLAAFAGMVICPLLCELLLLRTMFRHTPDGVVYALFLLGLTVSLIWFRPRRGERRSRSFPRLLVPALAGLLLILAIAGGILAGLVLQLWWFLPPALYGKAALATLVTAGTVAATCSVGGLIQGRLTDRRWCALYLLGLTGLVECMLLLSLLGSLSLDPSPFRWQLITVCRLGIPGLAGCIGAGVLLC